MATSRSRVSLRRDTGPPFRRILVANRGEIAVRIIRAARELGMEAVAVFSDADVDALHVRLADQAVRIGPAHPAHSYLDIEAQVAAAVRTGAEAIHPGYGFLAERAEFAAACADAGLAFVGPPAAVIAALGDKVSARRLATAAGVPPVPGTLDAIDVSRPDGLEALASEAARIGFPLLVKASAGGGGRGMRRVDHPERLPAAVAAGAAEAGSAFGDGSVYLERLISPSRHIEVQLLGDASGMVIAVGERDCSIQRRHQKLVEEAPAPGLTKAQRLDLHRRAVRIGAAAGLRNAATCEFLLDEAGEAWFLEVNTRLQVEHGVTELVADLDLVVEQFLLAAGRPLSDAARAAAVRAAEPASHAIEVRIGAEDPSTDFLPTPGRVRRWVMPAGPGVRVDAGIESGGAVPPMYDGLLAKIMVHGADRAATIARLRQALDETEISGLQTTLPFHRFVVRDEGFTAGSQSTDWIADRWDGGGERERAAAAAVAAAVHLASADLPNRPLAAVVPTRVSIGWRDAAREAAIDRWPR